MFRGIKFVPADTKIDFVSQRVISWFVSAFLTVVPLVLVATIGLNMGIDFQGGTLIEIKTKENPAQLSDIRSKISDLGLGEVQIQEFGAPDEVLIRIASQPTEEEQTVDDLPNHDGGDLDGVSRRFVDLARLALEVADAEGDALLESERVDPPEPRGADHAGVVAEEDQDPRLVGLDRHVAWRQDGSEEEEDHGTGDFVDALALDRAVEPPPRDSDERELEEEHEEAVQLEGRPF